MRVALCCFALLLGAAPVADALAPPTPTPPRPRPHRLAPTVTLEWVGDIAFSSAFGLPPGGPTAAFDPVHRELMGADITLGNLEGTLSTGGPSKCGSGGGGGTCFAFQAPPSYASGLRTSGFSLLNQANNHANDFGASGQRQTSDALNRAGLAYTGRPGQITIRSVRGLRIAFVGFAPYAYDSSLLDIGGAQRLIRQARRRAKLVVVIIHAGAEGAGEVHTPYGTEHYLGEDRGDPRRFAHAAIDAGASIVVGSGPHVIRGIERYHHHLIAYSLGNFAGPHTLSLGGRLSESAILRVTLNPMGRLVRGLWISIHLVSPGLPRLDPSHASLGLMATLSREDFGANRYRVSADGAITP